MSKHFATCTNNFQSRENIVEKRIEEKIEHIQSDNKYDIETELEDYVKRGGKLFIEYAEQLIKKPNFNFKIIQLESIRFFLKKCGPEGQPPGGPKGRSPLFTRPPISLGLLFY